MSSPWPEIALHERIGEGGIADVFRATWRGRPVAVKVLREAEHASLRARFLREGRILARLDHPGLVRCFEVLDGDAPALVLELLDGESLDARIARGALGEQEVHHLAAGLLRALGHLHDHGIVHRDVKPGNVIVTRGNRVVLLDLGLAAEAQDPLRTTLGEVIGTWAYMAPEQIAGADTDLRADLYALGVVLYEALAGVRPIEAHGLAAWLEAHRRGAVTPLGARVPGVSPRLAEVVAQLMARDPAQRPASSGTALALLTGAVGARRDLAAPPILGREALRGAVQALVDAGGLLRVQGEIGSGVGAAARLASQMSVEARQEAIVLRCRRRVGLAELRATLARAVGMEVASPSESELRAALADLARSRGALLVVEDVDVAPEGVVAWVRSLVTVPRLGVLLTATGVGEGGPETLILRPLRVDEVTRTVRAMLGTSAPPAGLDRALHTVSGGQPAIVVALLRAIVARGACRYVGVGEDGQPRWDWDARAPLVLGSGIAANFQRALQEIPDESRSVVMVVSVAGAPLPLDVALDAAGADPSGLGIGPALRAGLLDLRREDGEEWLTLRRAVLEPLVTAGAAEHERRRIHAAIAVAASRRPRPGDPTWSLAFATLHDALARRTEAHAEALVTLAERLVAEGRFVEALRLLDASMALPSDAVAAAYGARIRGEALLGAGRHAEARSALDAALRLAGSLGDLDAERAAAVAQARLLLEVGRAPDEDLVARVVEAAQLGARAAMLVVATLQARAGDGDAALAWGEAADGDDAIGSAALQVRASVLRARDPSGARALSEAGSLRWPFDAARHLCDDAAARLSVGDLAGALVSLDQAMRASRSPWTEGRARALRAGVLRVCNLLDEAAVELGIAGACGEAGGDWQARCAVLRERAALADARGDTPAALASHLALAHASDVASELAVASVHRGIAAALTGRGDDLVEALTDVRARGDAIGEALLLLHGGRTGRDAELLAEAARIASERGELVIARDAVAATRHASLASWLREIVGSLAMGMPAHLAAALVRHPSSRWAFEQAEGAATR